MCDALTEKDNAAFEANGGQLNRRDFSKLGVSALFASFYPTLAASAAENEMAVIETSVDVPMADGVSDSFFVSPAEGKYPGVLMWPDIRGLRPAFKAMAKRLAMSGYAVLVVNPFYRDAKAPVVPVGSDFGDPEIRKVLIPMYRNIQVQASAMSDARDYIKFLDAQETVDTSKKVGTCGYCMGGPLIMRTAGAVPERVGAAASFHGGGLATDKDDSPHLLIPTSPAHVLHAVAENDDERNPDAKVILAEAYKKAGIPAEIEVYEGTLHGWCPPDSKVYNEPQAEKAWSRMLHLFETALG